MVSYGKNHGIEAKIQRKGIAENKDKYFIYLSCNKNKLDNVHIIYPGLIHLKYLNAETMHDCFRTVLFI